MSLRSAVAAALATAAGLTPALVHADEGPALSIYGFARLDVIVDDAPMSDAQSPFFVAAMPLASDGSAGADGEPEFSMHPRLSRIGLTLDDWELAGPLRGEGVLEADFQGGAAAGATMRLRHAYVALRLRDKSELLLGQTWDLISPLYPSANNDSLMGNAGNTGDRRPQIRVTVTPNDRFRAAIAAGMSGAVDNQDHDGDGRMDGVAAGMPAFQGLLELRGKAAGDSPMRIGVWGHRGEERLGDGTVLAVAAVGGHVFVPVSEELALLGEVFRGRNLDDLRGGIGQGINRVTGKEIDATGGWLEAAYVINERHMLAGGATIDVPDTDDLEAGDRERNTTGYGVYRWQPRDDVQLGIEYIRWLTAYKAAPDRVANRVDVHLSVFF